MSKLKGKIEFKQVTFGYSVEVPVVNDINFIIQPGEKVAFVGTSGHGKSSLVKLLARFYDPNQGEIKLDDIPIKNLTLKQLREQIGYVFQETYLFGASVKENIRFGRLNATDEEVITAAKAGAAHEFIENMPDGYDSIVGERGNKLSGGQKQRISIARMILKNPAILVLDEATSALDNVLEDKVKQELNRLFHDRTIIAIAHRYSTIKDYDRIHVIENGEIVESGSYKQLLANKGAFFRIANREEVENANISVDI